LYFNANGPFSLSLFVLSGCWIKMSQDSKEWIKTRMGILRKQANQDLFISILLCLISGKDKHLILTAPPEKLAEVTQMASQVKLEGIVTPLKII